DFDHDGTVDALASDAINNKVSWFSNLVSTERVQHVISTAASNIRYATPTDLDGDGDTDVVAATGAGLDLTWLENLGDGSYASHVAAAGAATDGTILVADFDGDGDLDLAAATLTKYRWYANDGNENFTPHGLADRDSTFRAAAADVDGDGLIDVVSS